MPALRRKGAGRERPGLPSAAGDVAQQQFLLCQKRPVPVAVVAVSRFDWDTQPERNVWLHCCQERGAAQGPPCRR